jgi:hypothetical protein
MNAEKLSGLGTRFNPEPELTPAASEKLDLNIDSLRAQILREISRQSGHTGSPARASDVDSAVHRISLFDSASRIMSRTTILAVALSVSSLLVQLLRQIHSSDTVWLDSSVSLLVGVASGTTLVVIIQELIRRKRRAIAPTHEFLRTCGRLEDSMRSHARELLGPTADTASLGRIISAIELLQLWTPEDSQVFRRILATRNAIVHEDNRAISAGDVASAFSKTSRLFSLLSSVESSERRNRLKALAAGRAALSFEERVANALHQAGIRTSSAQRDSGYDLMAWKSDYLTRIRVRYRHSGLLTVTDISSAVDQAPPDISTVIVTNAEISPYVHEYLELLQGEHGSRKRVVAVRWQGNKDTDTLVNIIAGREIEV